MIGLLDAIATQPSETPLFAAGSRSITAGQIRKTASDIAAQLPESGPLFLHTESAALFAAGLLAASQKNLAIFLPAHLQPHYLREIGADKGTLLTDQIADISTALSITFAREAEEPRHADAQAHDLDLIFYTSGVTGAPKQVPKKIAQLDSEARTLEEVWGKRAGHTFATVSHQHIYGMLFRVFWPVIGGRVSQDRFAEYWERLAGKLSAETTLISSPAHLTRLPSAEVLAGSVPGLIFSAGAPLPFEAARETLFQLGSVPIEVLGSTETGGIGWRQQEREDALWTPLPGVRVVANEDGLMRVVSPFADGASPIATGDVVECVGSQFRLKGRADRIVKIDGKRVSLNRVEEALLTQPIVAAAAAVDLPSRKGALGAIVELNAEGKAALADEGAFRLSRRLRITLAPLLEPGERPKHWRFETIHQIRRANGYRRCCAPVRGKVARRRNRSTIGRQCRNQNNSGAGFDLVRGALSGSTRSTRNCAGSSRNTMGRTSLEMEAKRGGPIAAQVPSNPASRRYRAVEASRDVTKERLTFAYVMGETVASQGIIGGGT